MKNNLQPIPAFVHPDVSHAMNSGTLQKGITASPTPVTPFLVQNNPTVTHTFPTALVSFLIISLFILLFFLWVLKKIRMRDESEWG